MTDHVTGPQSRVTADVSGAAIRRVGDFYGISEPLRASDVGCVQLQLLYSCRGGCKESKAIRRLFFGVVALEISKVGFSSLGLSSYII